MRLYSIIMSICWAVLIVFTAVFGGPLGITPLYAVAATFCGTVLVITVDVTVSVLVRMLPERLFARTDGKHFAMSKKTRKLFNKLGIMKWKEKVPDLGRLAGFARRRVEYPDDNAYVKTYMTESAYGQIIHIAAAIFGFIVILFFPLDIWYCFGLPIAVVNAALNTMSMLVLRYNYGRMKILYIHNERKAKRNIEQNGSLEKNI